MHTLKPLDERRSFGRREETRALVTLEEHSVIGGLGSAVAELLAESAQVRTHFKRIGVPPRFSPRVGSQEFLLIENGLDVGSIQSTVIDLLERTP